MGNTNDKMDEKLMKVAPLDSEIITNIYYLHDAFWYMRMISMACDNIKHGDELEYCKTINLIDIGNIFKSAGYSLDPTSAFSKVLISAGETEIPIGEMQKSLFLTIDKCIKKPIKTIVNIHGEEITNLRDKLMQYRLLIQELSNENPVNHEYLKSVKKVYKALQLSSKVILQNEINEIPKFKENLIKVLEVQLNIYKNSILYLDIFLQSLKCDNFSLKTSELGERAQLDFDTVLLRLTHKYTKSSLIDSFTHIYSNRSFASRSSARSSLKFGKQMHTKESSQNNATVLPKASDTNTNSSLELSNYDLILYFILKYEINEE